MPRYISKDGVWHPQKERIALRNLSGKTKTIDGEEVKHGEEYIYKGADRAALFELFKEKVKTFGQDFRKNTEFLQAIRNMGFTNVDEYLKFVGYDEEKIEKEFQDKASVVHTDELPERVKAVETLGGGVDTAGVSKPKFGGFGERPND